MAEASGTAPGSSFRLKDLRLTVELLVEAVGREDGARERVATRHGVQKSVLTDAVRRMEQFFRVSLFEGPQRKSPTSAGRKMAAYGPRVLDEFEIFSSMLLDASQEDEMH